MAVGFDLRKDGLNIAVGSDDERGSLNAHVLLAVHGFLDPQTVSVDRCLVDIGEQMKGQIKLVRKLPVRVHIIGTDTDDDGVAGLDIPQVIAKTAGLFCAARRVVLG